MQPSCAAYTISVQAGSVGTYLTDNVTTPKLATTPALLIFSPRPTRQMLTYVVNHLEIDGFIPQNFLFIHHPNILSYSGDDEHHELNHK